MSEERARYGRIGEAIPRVEDLSLVTGARCFTDDIAAPEALHAVFLRSPYPRARITGIDASAALEIPGVVGVFTGKDLAADAIGDIPCGWLVKSSDGSDMRVASRPPLAVELVNFVGEEISMSVTLRHEFFVSTACPALMRSKNVYLKSSLLIFSPPKILHAPRTREVALVVEHRELSIQLQTSRNEKRDSSSCSSRERIACELRGR